MHEETETWRRELELIWGSGPRARRLWGSCPAPASATYLVGSGNGFPCNIFKSMDAVGVILYSCSIQECA